MEKEEKNSPKQEFKGRNLEDAISLAEHVFKMPRSQIKYEVVTEKTKLFGIKGKEIVIQAWPKKTHEDHPASKFLDSLLAHFPVNIRYQVKERNGMTFYIFEGEDRHFLLHKDGSLLLALQHLLNKISAEKVQLDCDFFRKRKEKELKEQAQRIAHKVKETGENQILDPLNPYERRIVHVVVNQIPGIATESQGDGFLKKIRIYVEKEPSS